MGEAQEKVEFQKKTHLEEVQHPENKNKKRNLPKVLIILGFLFSPIFLFIFISLSILLIGVIAILEADDLPDLSHIGEAEIPTEFIPVYMEAGEKYEIDWILLAAIHRVESNFSRNLGVSTAGAIGHTQFMPCSWIGWGHPSCGGLGRGNIPENVLTDPSMIAKYGGYGVDANGDGKADPWDIHDAIHATAKYLKAHMSGSSKEEQLRNAIFGYNHADWYVDLVLGHYMNYTSGYSQNGNIVAEIKGNKAWVVPYTKTITSYFGMRNGKPHNGIDIASQGVFGQPAVAFADGEVIYSQFNAGGYGYLVIIQHEGNISTYYAHLKQQGIPKGTKVKAGQVIGYIGNTGRSRGAHLHFEIRMNGKPVDPIPYLKDFL